jgi:hypothetical protein
VAAADNALADLAAWRAAQRRAEAELEAAALAKQALHRAHAATASASSEAALEGVGGEDDGAKGFWEGASRDALAAAADARARLEASMEASRLHSLQSEEVPSMEASQLSSSSECNSSGSAGRAARAEASYRQWSPAPSAVLGEDERARAWARAQAAEELELAAGGDLGAEAEGLSQELAELNALLAQLDESDDESDAIHDD